MSIPDPKSNKTHKPVITGSRKASSNQSKKVVSSESEALFQTIFEQNAMGMVQALPNGDIIRVNSKFCEILEFQKEELLGKNLSEITFSEDLKIEQKILNNVRTGKIDSFQLEKRYLRKDGSTIWAKLHSTVIRDKHGNVKYAIGTVHDITAQRRTQTALQNSLVDLQLAQEIASIGNWTFDPSTGVPEWSKLIYKIYERDPELGPPHIDEYKKIYQPSQYKIFSDAIQKAIMEGTPYEIELRLDLENGRKKWIKAICKPDPEKGESGHFLRGTIHDISAQKVVENELRNSKQRFELVMEASQDGIWDWNLKTNELYFSQGWREILELDEVPSGPEILENRISKADRPKFLRKLYSHIKGETEYWEFDHQVWTGRGHWKWVKGKGKVVERNEKNEAVRMVGRLRDIDQQKRYEQELMLAKEKAEESDRLKSAFLANMSHEIRTPMNGILGFTALLADPHYSGKDKEKYIKIIQKSGERLINTINDIIDISRIESGDIGVEINRININDELMELASFFEPELKKKDIELNLVKGLPHHQATIHADKNKLLGILTNLIKNAIKFTDKGSIRIGYTAKEDSIEFFVSDTGIGIPKEKLESIFDRFVQANLSNTSRYEGSGLGLSITRSFVNLLGGKMWVESEEGKGSVFYFTIKHNSLTPSENTVRKKASDSYSPAPDKRMKILIADDEDPEPFRKKKRLSK